MVHPLFADDHKLEAYWLDQAPPPDLPEPVQPKSADVAVVGSGYTGLSAALTVAREGRSVIVFDAEDAGWGCSSRNGGQCGAGLKPGLDGLTRRYGKSRAKAMYGDAMASLEYLVDFIEREQIECDLIRPGRFVGAHTPGKYDEMAHGFEMLNRELGIECYAVPKAEQHGEIGSDLYHGGVVIANHAAVHPARYHRGLLERALSAGVEIAAHTPVTRIERTQTGFEVTTPRGVTAARDVVVATNGYTNTSAILPGFARRVIPIGSYMIATEPLAPGLIDRLMPKNRVLNDTRRVVLYWRATPDRTRIVFGGRVALAETDPLVSGPRLHAVMSGIHPELADVKISHSWMGFVAYTFDKLPHLGVRDGMHYAMGYCGSGVAMGSYLGHKAGLKVLGDADGATAFDDLPLQTRPFYGGKPWFLAGAVAYYRMRDRLAR